MSSHAAAPAKEGDAPAKKGLSGKLKVGIIVAVIVLLQCGLAYFFLFSSGGDAAAQSKTEAKGHGKDAGHGEAASEENPHGERREVDLGKFSITSVDPTSNATVLIDFHLYGAVLVDEEDVHAEAEAAHGDEHGKKDKAAEPEDTSKFGKLLKKNKHRFRDQVIVIIRNSQMSDLADPSLGFIKRQILAKTNSLLGGPLLKEVIFSDFAVVQQ